MYRKGNMITVGEFWEYLEDKRIDNADIFNWDLHGLVVSFFDEVNDEDIEIDIRTNECGDYLSFENEENENEAA